MPTESNASSDLLITPNEDSAVALETFLMEQYLTGAEPVLKFQIVTGREDEQYDPESLDLDENDRDKPDPVFRAYADDDEFVLTLTVPYHDLVFFALRVETDLTPAVLNLLTSVEEDYDGIHAIEDVESMDTYSSVEQAVDLIVSQLAE